MSTSIACSGIAMSVKLRCFVLVDHRGYSHTGATMFGITALVPIVRHANLHGWLTLFFSIADHENREEQNDEIALQRKEIRQRSQRVHAGVSAESRTLFKHAAKIVFTTV